MTSPYKVNRFPAFRDSVVVSEFSILEEEGITLFRNVGNRLPSNATSYPRRRQSFFVSQFVAVRTALEAPTRITGDF